MSHEGAIQHTADFITNCLINKGNRIKTRQPLCGYFFFFLLYFLWGLFCSYECVRRDVLQKEAILLIYYHFYAPKRGEGFRIALNVCPSENSLIL